MTVPAPAAPEIDVRTYPEAMAAPFVARANALVPGSTPRESVLRLDKAAGALSDAFTTDRPARFEDYARNDEARLAYALMFAPQMWVRVRFPLAEAIELRGWTPPGTGPIRILDLGAGIGAAGLSAAQLLRTRFPDRDVDLLAFDHSASALRELAPWREGAGEPLARIRTRTQVGDLARGPGALGAAAPFHLVVASFSWNEAFASQSDAEAAAAIGAWASRLDPDGLFVLVEPAIRAIAERLRRLGAAAVAAGGLHVLGPDLDGKVDLSTQGGRFHDHEARRWTPPQSLKWINARLKRSLTDLTFAWMTLSPRPPRPLPPDASVFRLTSPISTANGRLIWTGLAADGQRHEYEVLTRAVTEEAKARLRRIERGDVLAVEGLTVVGSPPKLRAPSGDAIVARFSPA